MGIPFIAPVLKIAEISVTYDSARKHRQDGLPGGHLAPPVALCLPFRRTIAFSGAMKGIPILWLIRELQIYLNGFCKRGIRPETRKDSQKVAGEKYEDPAFTTSTLTIPRCPTAVTAC